MKKFLFSIALTITLGLTASAQFGGDGFFNNWDDMGNGLSGFNLFNNLDDFDNGLRDGPGTPGHGGGDQPAPLGSGLLILTALGAGYTLKKNAKNSNIFQNPILTKKAWFNF